MTGIQVLAMQRWVERLGLTLLQFLWQGTVVAIVYASARKFGTQIAGPSGRYALACTALTTMAIAPVATWVLQGERAPQSAVSFTAPMSAGRSEISRPIILSLPSDAYRPRPRPFLSWVVAFWLAGATAFSVRLLGGWMLAERLRYRVVRPAPAEWQRTLDRLKSRISVSRHVTLLVSGLVNAPAAIGWFRPMVLMPVAALTGLPPAQIEALLLHELAHIRRHDYLVHIFQSAVEAIFFYHPAVWWISGHMRAERELCCDDIAVSITGNAVDYARALAEIDAARWIQPVLMAANGGPLAGRIARLLGQPSTSRRTSGGPAGGAALILLAIGAWTVFAQSAVRPRFEVASVKPSSSQSIQYVRPLPGRLTADASLPILMQYAYGVQPFQITGGPERRMSERYEIDAKAEGHASRAQILLMLQSLLEERFKLKTHRETRDQPAYALVAAKSGLKLPPPKEGVCVSIPSDAPVEWAGGRIAVPGEVQPAKGLCGTASVHLEPTGPRIEGGRIGMPEFVRMISRVLGRSVIDRTGFLGRFDLQLDFVADETTPAMPPPPPGSEMPGRSISQALREQLGLQLEPTKGPVEIIVVDRAQPPSGN